MVTRRNLLYTLIAISLVLIIINISVEVATRKVETTIPTISKNEIETKFAVTLSSYGICSDWIKKVYVKQHLSDSLNYLFNISIPNDILIATLLKDINNMFVDLPVVIKSAEKKNHSNSVLKIYSNDVLKLQANLKHSSKVLREFAEYSFLVYVNPEDVETPINKASKIFYDFTYLLVPTKISNKIKNEIKKNYDILLNDQIIDHEYSLKEEFSKQKLINNIRTIILTFGKDRLYLIDENSTLFKSKIFSLLRDEFGSRGIKLKALQSYNKIEGNTPEQLNSLLNFYSTSLKGKKGKTFVIELNNFITLSPTIENYIKKGYKVVEVVN